jgi:hypothetical protein
VVTEVINTIALLKIIGGVISFSIILIITAAAFTGVRVYVGIIVRYPIAIIRPL